MKQLRNIFLLSVLAMVSTTSMANGTYGNNGTYQNQSWEDIYKQTVGEVKKKRAAQNENFIYNVNQRLNAIEKSKRTTFTINAPRVVDVYVRESYTVVENKYVVKNAPIWKKVLIKQEEIWDY